MSLPFRRSRRPSQRVSDASLGSFAPPTQRAWEVEVVLYPLHPMVRDALRPWLLWPTDLHRWPPPDSFSERRSPISEEEAGDGTRPVASKLLRDELRAILQTLAVPPAALSGLTRNGLLTVHAIRLRQLEHWLWPFYAAREITRLTR